MLKTIKPTKINLPLSTPSKQLAASLAACLALVACGGGQAPSNPIVGGNTPAGVSPNSASRQGPVPLQGLTPAQLVQFEQGQALFEKVFTPATGLGPVFNAQSCAECHAQPFTGGTHPSTTIERFRTLGSPLFVAGLLTQDQGAPHVHSRSVAEEFPEQVPGCNLAPEQVPANALASTTRVTPHVLGIGLVENIPDLAIIENGLAQQQANPEVSGRPGLMFPGGINDFSTADQLVGRFGARGFVADVMAFTQGAFHTELGIATFHPLFSVPVRPSGTLAPLACTPFVGEAVSLNEARAVADFQRLLAPPPPPELDAAALRGQQLFEDIACVSCHTPMLKTSAFAAAPLNDQEVWLYSDLLLHDMGPELADGAPEGLGSNTEWRTAPLWGSGQFNKPLMHDGRAGRDFAKAIELHGGEASGARSRFQALSPQQKADLLAFLQKL